MLKLPHGIFDQTMSPRFFFSRQTELNVLISAEISELLGHKTHTIVGDDDLRLGIGSKPSFRHSFNHLRRAFRLHGCDGVWFHQGNFHSQPRRKVNAQEELDLYIVSWNCPFRSI